MSFQSHKTLNWDIFDEILGFSDPAQTATDSFKAQKSSMDNVKIVHVTSVEHIFVSVACMPGRALSDLRCGFNVLDVGSDCSELTAGAT